MVMYLDLKVIIKKGESMNVDMAGLFRGAANLINKRGLVKGNYALNKSGVSVEIDSKHAHQFCVYGSLKRAYFNKYGTFNLKGNNDMYNTANDLFFDDAIGNRIDEYTEFRDILSFNDNDNTSKEDAVRFLNKVADSIESVA